MAQGRKWSSVKQGRRRRAVAAALEIFEGRLLMDATNGLLGSYFNNMTLSGTPVTRIDSQINFTWNGVSPIAPLGTTAYSVRWTGSVVPQFSEKYTFYITSDDGNRLTVNGVSLTNNWVDHNAQTKTGTINLVAGQAYAIDLDYYQNTGGAKAELEWSSPSQARQVIPSSALLAGGGTVITAPTAPTGLTARTVSSSEIDLSWTDNASDETGFVVEESTNNGSTWTSLPAVPANSPGMAVTGLAAKTAYSFRVRATGSAIDSVPTAALSATTWPNAPKTPAGLSATYNTTTGLITLKWSDVTDEAGFVLQRSTDGSTYSGLASPATGTLSFVDPTPPAAGSTVYYEIAAVDASGASAFSAPASVVIPAPVTPANGTGLRGLYYDTMTLSGDVVSRLDSSINFNWGSGAPVTGMPSDHFSVSWTGKIQAKYSEAYTFYATTDDGVLLWVNGQLIVNNWQDHSAQTNTGTITLAANALYDITMEYYDDTGNASAKLEWSSKSQARQVIPTGYLYPAADPLAAPPMAPTSFTATPASQSQVALVWTDNSNNELGFQIERSTDGSHFSIVTTTQPNVTTYMDSGLNPSTLYYYRIMAVNNVGNSDYTAIIQATTDAPPTTTTHPAPSLIGDFQTSNPPNLVTLTSPRANNIFYAGEAPTFWLSSAVATTYEVRDYDGNLVDSGVATQTLLPHVSTLGWYKLYLYGNTVTTTWGDVVGGTTFSIVRQDSVLPPLPAVSNFIGDFDTPVVTRVDSTINFNWGTGSPDPAVNSDDFGAIWSGAIVAPATGTYTLYFQGDDRGRVFINGQKLIDFWGQSAGGGEYSANIALQAGQRYDIQVQYFEWQYSASAKLSWSGPGLAKQVVPASALYPTDSAGSPGGLTGAYYNVLTPPDFALDPDLHAAMGMGLERLSVTNPSNVAASIAYLQQYVTIEKQLYPNQPLQIIVAFPNGTSDLNSIKQIVAAMKGSIQYWEGRNEPNSTVSGATFVTNELIPFYNAIKSVDPTMQVVGPEVVTVGPYGLQWLDGFFAAGGGKYINALSFHAYNDVNGDLALITEAMQGLQALLVKYNLANIPKFQTEQGFMASDYGAYQPRTQARWTMLEQMVFAQYGIPPAQNFYWYDRDSGYRAFPMYWINQDGSINPVGDMMRVWSEETAGLSFASAFDFGADADTIYTGDLFSNGTKSVAAFMAPGTPDGQIQLAVSSGSALTVVSSFGVTTTIPVTNGVATLNVPDTPVYVEMAPGQTIRVLPANWGADLALQTGVTASASGTSTTGNNAISKIYNGQIEDWYWSQQPNADVWTDNTSGFPAWVQINLPTAQTVDRAVIYAGVPWQTRGSLLDYSVQALENGQWVTVDTVHVDPATFPVYSPETQTTDDSFYDEQYVFVNTFAPVVTTSIRLVVLDTTYGGAATLDAKEAGAQSGVQHIQLAEFELFGQ